METRQQKAMRMMVEQSMPSHRLQWKLLDLAQRKDLGKLSLRGMARELREKIHPQKMKHHLAQLEKRGLIRFYTHKDTYERRCYLDRKKVSEAIDRLFAEQP